MRPIRVGLVLLLAWALPPLCRWALADATWIGDRTGRGCAADGACWAFIRARWALFFYGPYPSAERWRVDLAARPAAWPRLLAALFVRRGTGLGIARCWSGVPVVSGVLLAGGVFGLPAVPTADWGGLSLNVVLCFVGRGRRHPARDAAGAGPPRAACRSSRGLCTALVEFWRGVPILAVLFMGLVLLPMMLPPGWRLDNLVRAIVVLDVLHLGLHGGGRSAAGCKASATARTRRPRRSACTRCRRI